MTAFIEPPDRLTRRDAFATLLLGVAAVAVTFDAWADIYRLGTVREELSYVLLAPAVIGFIVWSRRGRLAGCTRSGAWSGLPVLCVGWAVWHFGFLSDPVLWRGGAVMMTVGAVLTGVGLPAALRLWPAFVAAVFLVPVSPDGRYQVALPLQVATAQATQAVCDVIGFDVSRSGNMLSINGVDVTVAEACNGMRMAFTLLLVCYAVAFTGTSRWWLGAAVLLLSPLVAIVANVARLVPTVWVFGHASAATAEAFHEAAGWVMLAVAFVLLSGLLRLAEVILVPTVQTREPSRALPTAPAAKAPAMTTSAVTA